MAGDAIVGAALCRTVIAALAGFALAFFDAGAIAKPPECTAGSNCPRFGLTPDEALAKAEAERASMIADDLFRTAQRADRQLLNKYADEAARQRAKLEEVEIVLPKLRLARARLDELLAQRKHLDDEAEFYLGKPLPPTLRRSVDASDASLTAMADVFRGLEADIAFIVARHDADLARLRQLWAGAAPGSLGLLASAAPARR
jgi:hypothetical protein